MRVQAMKFLKDVKLAQEEAFLFNICYGQYFRIVKIYPSNTPNGEWLVDCESGEYNGFSFAFTEKCRSVTLVKIGFRRQDL